MKPLFIILLFTGGLVGCKTWRPSYQRDNGCIMPTYYNAQQRAGWGLPFAQMGGRAAVDTLIRRTLHDLKVEYIVCQKQKFINYRQQYH